MARTSKNEAGKPKTKLVSAIVELEGLFQNVKRNSRSMKQNEREPTEGSLHEREDDERELKEHDKNMQANRRKRMKHDMKEKYESDNGKNWGA